MATDKLMNHSQGESIITNLGTIATNLQNVTAISPAKFGMGYAVCDTAAGTAAKTANLANYVLTEGAPVSVKFTYANTASNATLNLNSTGAKPIYYKGSAIGNDVISAGDICTFIYSTTVYNIINIDTLTGAGTGTVTQVGAENGLITDQSGNADITRIGKVKLNLKSDTAFATEVAAQTVATDNMYPVALDSEGHPVAAVPTASTTGKGVVGIKTSVGSASSASETDVPTEKAVADAIAANQTNISSVEDMICDNEFSTSTAYSVGDIVTYEHGLYEFTSAHSAGAWDSTEVTEINVVDKIGSGGGGSVDSVSVGGGTPYTPDANGNIDLPAYPTPNTYTGSGAISVDASTKVISHSTSAGYKHIPSGGSTGQFLKYSSSGTASWQPLPYGSESAQGAVRVWTTTVGSDTVLHISNQAAT